MAEFTSHPLDPLVEKLSLWQSLSDTDMEAIRRLPYQLRSLRDHDFIVREGDNPRFSCLLVSGYAFRHKVVSDGGRQIFSLHMRGDMVDLHNSLLRRADHNVQALTDIEIAMIPVEAVRKVVADYPLVGQAMWFETLVDAAIFREWTLNVGRRDARTRLAHMLCEFALRLQAVGLGELSNYELPMTQDELADVLALTNVHVSRTLKALSDEGLIERTRRFIRIADFDHLAVVGDFDPAYLHLERVRSRL